MANVVWVDTKGDRGLLTTLVMETSLCTMQTKQVRMQAASQAFSEASSLRACRIFLEAAPIKNTTSLACWQSVLTGTQACLQTAAWAREIRPPKWPMIAEQSRASFDFHRPDGL